MFLTIIAVCLWLEGFIEWVLEEGHDDDGSYPDPGDCPHPPDPD